MHNQCVKNSSVFATFMSYLAGKAAKWYNGRAYILIRRLPMNQDFDTFLIGLYLIVSDWLQTHSHRYVRPQGGTPPRCSDGEVLTLILAHQLSQATWHERPWLRWLEHNGYRAWFPHLPSQ